LLAAPLRQTLQRRPCNHHRDNKQFRVQQVSLKYASLQSLLCRNRMRLTRRQAKRRS